MIIWLASYPKSGNTWVRLFLNNLLYSDNKDKSNLNDINIRLFPLRSDFNKIGFNCDNVDEFVSKCNYAQSKLNLDQKIKIFKTHNALWKTDKFSFTGEQNTLGVIHIVRDPRNVITSITNHYGKDYDEALKFMLNEKQSIGLKSSSSETDLPTIISSWKNHYNSWKRMKKNYLLIKYENLMNDREVEFGKITEYLKKFKNFHFDENQTQKIIESCSFEKLQKEEQENGFKEAAKQIDGAIKKFFFLGPKNKWENILKVNIKEDLENSFKNEMKELGYL